MGPGVILAGRYELVGLLGRGPHGRVWRGVDRELGRSVAVKTVPEPAAPPGAAAAPGDRAQHAPGAPGAAAPRPRPVAAERLAHPHIVAVYDDGRTTHEGTPYRYVVRELVEGRPLSAVLAEGRPELSVALAWARQIAMALEAAHAPGVESVHGNLSPGNVLITDDGPVKITDFGAPAGSPAYLAPEQFLARPVHARTDLYALGCVLYELVTGAPPFTGRSASAVAHAHVHDVPATPSRRNDAVSPELDLLIRDLLAKTPDLRPPDASSVFRRLGVIAAAHAEALSGTFRPAVGSGQCRPVARPPVKDIRYAELLHRFAGADALVIEGDSGTAVQLWQAAVTELTAALGPTHPNTLTARRALAWHTGAGGDHTRAVALWTALIPDARSSLGRFHEAGYTAQRMLAWNTGLVGRHAEAVRLLTGLLPGATRLLGRRHPDILEARRFLVWNTSALGHHARAMRLLRRLLPVLSTTLGPTHEHTLEARRMLAWNVGQAGDRGKAVAMLRDLVPVATRALGTAHSQTADTLRLLDRYTR